MDWEQSRRRKPQQHNIPVWEQSKYPGPTFELHTKSETKRDRERVNSRFPETELTSTNRDRNHGTNARHKSPTGSKLPRLDYSDFYCRVVPHSLSCPDALPFQMGRWWKLHWVGSDAPLPSLCWGSKIPAIAILSWGNRAIVVQQHTHCAIVIQHIHTHVQIVCNSYSVHPRCDAMLKQDAVIRF